MKKLCTRCGNPLNLAEKQCASCGAFNPFYMASFRRQNTANAGMDALEEQLLATETVETAAKLPLIGQREMQSIVQEAETGLKQEILKVKDETAQYKKQTFELVQEVRQELQHIDEENRRLKQEVEMLSQTRAGEPAPAAQPRVAQTAPKNERRFLGIAAVFVVIFCSGLGYFLTEHRNAEPAVMPASPMAAKPADKPAPQPEVKAEAPSTPAPQPEVKVEAPATPAPKPEVKMMAALTPAQPTETPAPKKWIAAAAPATHKPIPAAPPVNENEQPVSNAPVISETSVKNDIIGSKLSGCGITINDPAEITSFGNLKLIETAPSGETKYKVSLRVVQNGEIYYATPYIYYNANGVLTRIDGTNCE